MLEHGRPDASQQERQRPPLRLDLGRRRETMRIQVEGTKLNRKKVEHYVGRSLVLVAWLSPHIVGAG